MADARESGVININGRDARRLGCLRRTGAGLVLHDICDSASGQFATTARIWRHAHTSRRTAKAHEYIITFRRPEAQA